MKNVKSLIIINQVDADYDRMKDQTQDAIQEVTISHDLAIDYYTDGDGDQMTTIEAQQSDAYPNFGIITKEVFAELLDAIKEDSTYFLSSVYHDEGGHDAEEMTGHNWIDTPVIEKIQNELPSNNEAEIMYQIRDGLTAIEDDARIEDMIIISRKNVQDEAELVNTHIRYETGNEYDIPFIVYSNGVFMPGDWTTASAIDVDDIKGTDWIAIPEWQHAIMLNDLPRIF